jgi:hypothetical protein
MVRGNDRIIAVPPSIRCVNAFLGNFYGNYWLFANASKKRNSTNIMMSMVTSLINEKVDEKLTEDGFYSGEFGKRHTQLFDNIGDFFSGERDLNDVFCMARHFYSYVIDAFTEQFFYGDRDSFLKYIGKNEILRFGPDSISINVPFCFGVMENYGTFESVLENIYEGYVQLDRVFADANFSEDVKKSFLFLMPTTEKMVKIFNKIGHLDDVFCSVTVLNEWNLPFDETRRYVCEICVRYILTDNLLLSINYMGLTPGAQKGLWIIFHELEFSENRHAAKYIRKIRKEFAVCPDLPALGFVEPPQHSAVQAISASETIPGV